MRSFLFFLVLCSFLSTVSALSISVPSQAAVSIPTRVSWALDPGDDTEWDFRFVKDGWDVGLAAANVRAGNKEEGQVDVNFPSTGDFVLVAVTGSQSEVIGQSLQVQVLNALPTSSSVLTSTTRSPSISISTVLESATSTPSSDSRISPKVNVAAIVGGLLGGLLLVLLIILLIILIRRRRAASTNGKTTRRFTFHRSWMVRPRDPEPAPPMSQIDSAPTSSGPRGPRPGKHLRPLVLGLPRTDRQQMLDERVVELLEEISSLPHTPAPGGRGMSMSGRLGEIRRKIRWAREMKDSPWARGETDVRPLGWEECMTGV